MAKKKVTKTEESKTTYLIEFENNNRQRITVPSKWKVTFGPLAIRGANSGRKVGLQQKMPIALRFYENDNRQRAVFTNVLSFRDMSIGIEEERVDIQQKNGYVECDGRKKNVAFQATSKQWVNPDGEEESAFPALPADVDIFGEKGE